MSRSTTLFRTIAICLLMACMTIFMFGCGEKQPADAKAYDLQQVYQDLMNAQPADIEDLSGVMFETTDKDAINGTYHGLADIELKQEVCYQHAVTGFCEVMLVETASPDDVQKVIDIFNARMTRSIRKPRRFGRRTHRCRAKETMSHLLHCRTDIPCRIKFLAKADYD